MSTPSNDSVSALFALGGTALADAAAYEKSAPWAEALRPFVTKATYALCDERGLNRTAAFGAVNAEVKAGQHAERVALLIAEARAAGERKARTDGRAHAARQALVGDYQGGFTVAYDEARDLFSVTYPKHAAIIDAMKTGITQKNRRWDKVRECWIVEGKSHAALKRLTARLPELVQGEAETAWDRKQRLAAEAKVRRDALAAAMRQQRLRALVGEADGLAVVLLGDQVELRFAKHEAAIEHARAAGLRWNGRGWADRVAFVDVAVLEGAVRRIRVALAGREQEETDKAEARRKEAEARHEAGMAAYRARQAEDEKVGRIHRRYGNYGIAPDEITENGVRYRIETRTSWEHEYGNEGDPGESATYLPVPAPPAAPPAAGDVPSPPKPRAEMRLDGAVCYAVRPLAALAEAALASKGLRHTRRHESLEDQIEWLEDQDEFQQAAELEAGLRAARRVGAPTGAFTEVWYDAEAITALVEMGYDVVLGDFVATTTGWRAEYDAWQAARAADLAALRGLPPVLRIVVEDATGKTVTDATVRAGARFSGGWLHLPGQPLGFLCRVALEAAGLFEAAAALPTAGLLPVYGSQADERFLPYVYRLDPEQVRAEAATGVFTRQSLPGGFTATISRGDAAETQEARAFMRDVVQTGRFDEYEEPTHPDGYGDI